MSDAGSDEGTGTNTRRCDCRRTVRLRDKVRLHPGARAAAKSSATHTLYGRQISFLCGVMNVLVSSLLLGFRPTWVPDWYGIQMLFYMPFRVITYKSKNYH